MLPLLGAVKVVERRCVSSSFKNQSLAVGCLCLPNVHPIVSKYFLAFDGKVQTYFIQSVSELDLGRRQYEDSRGCRRLHRKARSDSGGTLR